jgi:hypothetical protein
MHFLQRISFEIVFKFDFIMQHEDMLYNQCGAVTMHDGLLSHFPFIFIFLMHVIFYKKCRN